MKKILSIVTAAALTIPAAASMPPKVAKADNPMIQTIFSTDPAPMVYDDTVYVYTGRDKDNSDFYYMPDWHCYSSKDMQNWTDHGMILSWDSFSWGKEDSAWASQCIERNGKFYYYVTLENKTGGGRAIGVAVADSPTGPFKDAIGKPLCGPNWDYIDPTVFIDDDGQAWLMFGNPTCYYVKLNEDMISLDGSIGHFDMNSSTFGPGGNKASSYGEGPWFYKRGDLYYLVYAAFYNGEGSESIGYSTAPSPTGPWTYRGQVMKKHNCFTNHPGVIDFKGRSYLFYHDASLPHGGTFDRSVCVDEFSYKSDGTIPVISPSKSGPKQIASVDPYKRTEAETICNSSGIKTENCSAGGINIANIENGDYVKVSGVDFGSGTDKFTASVASAAEGGNIEMYLDSLSGRKIGTCSVPATGGWQDWEKVSCNVSGASGEHDLYFKFTGGSGYLFNVDWWQFGDDEGTSSVTTSSSAPIQQTTTTTVSVPSDDAYLLECSFEGGTDGFEGRAGAKVASSSKVSFRGSSSLYCSERTAAYQGAYIDLGSKFKAGESYSFSVNAMYENGKDSDTFHFTMQYDDANGDTHYEKIATVYPLKGEWAQLSNTSFRIPEGAENVNIYVETDKSTCDFYIDDLKIAKAGTVINGAVGGVYMPGDVNMDGDVNSLDLVRARKIIIAQNNGGASNMNADVDKSSQFEVNDIVLLQRYLIGKIVEFPDNTPEPEVSAFNYNSAVQYKEAPGNYLNSCSQAGRIVKESYSGINGQNSLNVYLPYGYDESKKYNIFYLMHGGGENENTIFSNDVKLNNILDHMIMNGELEPMIVVTPTFNKTEAGKFYDEFRRSVVPFVEKKYSTYADKDVSEANLKATRMHRAYGGFSMGGLSTWCVADHDMDIVGYFMPLSGNNWEGMNTLTKEIDSLGLKKNQYFIFAATGSDDIAYPNMLPEMNDLKTRSKYFTYTSDFSQGNLYWLVAQGKTHWWGFVRHYVYDALPYFFHETGE